MTSEKDQKQQSGASGNQPIRGTDIPEMEQIDSKYDAPSRPHDLMPGEGGHAQQQERRAEKEPPGK